MKILNRNVGGRKMCLPFHCFVKVVLPKIRTGTVTFQMLIK